MKITGQLFLLFLFAFIKFSYSQTNEFKRYSIESAIVEYDLKGMQTGTAIMYFKEYGMSEATYETAVLEIFGEKQETATVNYLLGFWQYNLDIKNNVGTKSKNTTLESIVRNSGGDLEQVGLDMFVSMGGKKIGKETMIGKLCDIWELESMSTKVWVWRNIPLKTETDMMGMKILRVATYIEENANIPPEKITIPSDIIFTEIEMNSLDK